MQFALSDLFSSGARTRTLEVLFQQSEPIGLRQLANLCALPVRSVQCAVADLTKERLMLRKKAGQRVLLSLNREHPAFNTLRAVLQAAAASFITRRAENYTPRAKALLALNTFTARAVSKARSTVP